MVQYINRNIKGLSMIVPEKIKVKLNPANMKHYKQFGITGLNGEIVEVCSTQLTKSSREYVTRICDECGNEHRQMRNKVHSLCKKCATSKANKERADTDLTTCKCGNKKAYGSELCRECYNKLDHTGENSPSFGVKNPHKSSLENRQKGETHWNWQGGKTKRSGEQIAWAKKVKELAGEVCDCCGYGRKYALEAHHLHSDNTDKGEFTMENGVALCANCHKEFHKKYGFGDNTPEQYVEFKGGYNE